MKKLYLFANHKMNMDMEKLAPYLKALPKICKTHNVVGLAVSNIYLPLACEKLKKQGILYGAQNIYEKEAGAYTGETSVLSIKDFGAKICLVGHSERRQYFNETNEQINEKIKLLLKHAIKPVLCFGETKQERDDSLTKKVIKTQLTEALNDITKDEVKKIVFAYEPVWAIGTGESATAKQAEDTARFIKEYLCKTYELIESDIVLLYGGSLNSSNAEEILSKTHIDGGLIGGAGLKLEEFEKLIKLKIEE